MSGPPRLSELGGELGQYVDSASLDGPSEGVRRAITAALGITALGRTSAHGVSRLASGSTAAGAPVAQLATSTLTKILLGTAMTVSFGAGGIWLSRTTARSVTTSATRDVHAQLSSSVAETRPIAPPPSVDVQATSARSETSLPHANTPLLRQRPASAVPRAPVPPTIREEQPPRDFAGSDLFKENRLLDRVLFALQASQYDTALSLVDEYERAFPHGTLVSEAIVAKIEALWRRGDRDEAERIAATFLAAAPDSPLANRVRELVQSP